MNIEEKITLYPELSGEERATVEAYVEAHPEWKSALDEAKRLDRLLNDVRQLGQDPSGDEALAYYVVTRHLQPSRAPGTISDLIRRIEEQIARDPAMAIRVAEMEARLQAAEESSPASEQFERLMKQHRSISESASNGSEAESHEERPAASSTLWRMAAALAALIALYGVLYLAGDLMRPPHERLAEFTEQELALEGYEVTRGEAYSNGPGEPMGIYLDALAHLRAAESSVLGLFPRFDEVRLNAAATRLQEVLEIEPADSFLAGEAAFLLGKTELGRGNVESAEQAFRRVVEMDGRKAPEARRLLADLGS